ncbi:MAG: PDZ domain-containing protein [bacterium]|nr:PDZ domain-containing protein [bacterium]
MEQLTSSKYTRVKIIISITILAVIAGYVGGLSGQNYIDYLRQFIQPEQIIQRAGSTRAFSLVDLLANTSPSLVSLYSLDDNNSTDVVYPLPTAQSYLGDAVAVASDGWLVTPEITTRNSAEKKDSSVEPNYFVIYKQIVYPVTTIVTDPVAGVSFLKIEGVWLKPASFGWDQSAVGTIGVHGVSSVGVVSSFFLGPPHYSSAKTTDLYVSHTNKLNKFFNPDMQFSQRGMAIVSDNGDIIGLTAKNGVIPSYRFRSSLDQVLTNHEIKRISSNASYYDNAWMPHIQFNSTALLTSGATIIDPGNMSSKEPLSGLQKGDIVLHINNENVDINRSLSDILNQYNPGDTVKAGIQRAGTDIDLSLILK